MKMGRLWYHNANLIVLPQNETRILVNSVKYIQCTIFIRHVSTNFHRIIWYTIYGNTNNLIFPSRNVRFPFFRFSDVFAFSMTNFDKIHADFVLYYSPEKGYGVLAEIPLASAYGVFAFVCRISCLTVESYYRVINVIPKIALKICGSISPP